MNSVVFAPRALVDFEVAVRWYQRQNPRVAERFRHALSDCVKRIVSAPRMRPRCLMARDGHMSSASHT